jgi:serine/threonine-protein kinase
MGVRSWAFMAAVLLFGVVLGALGFINARFERARPILGYLVPVCIFAALILHSRVVGAFMGLPPLVMLAAIAFGQQPHRGLRIFGVGAAVAGVISVVVLEAVGVLPPSYLFQDGRIIVLPQMLDLPALPTQLTLLSECVILALICAFYVSYLRDSLDRAEQRLHVQHWQLRQLLPSEAREAVRVPSGETPTGSGRGGAEAAR